MELAEARRIIEALLFMTDHPLTIREIQEVLDLKTLKEENIREILNEIKETIDQTHSALCLVEVAGGIQFAARPEMAPWIRKLYKERLTVRLSNSALETLSIIAYKQPIARSEVEQIRGVEASGVMDTLIERRLVKVVGRKETIGRPLLYGTTQEFLRQFGLNHLADLPDLESVTPATDSESIDADPPSSDPDELPLEKKEDVLAADASEEGETELVAVGGETESIADPKPDKDKPKIDLPEAPIENPN